MTERVTHSTSSAIDQVNFACNQLNGVNWKGSLAAGLLFEYYGQVSAHGRMSTLAIMQARYARVLTCSLGGKLNKRSASIRDLLSLCRNATSLFLNAEK